MNKYILIIFKDGSEYYRGTFPTKFEALDKLGVTWNSIASHFPQSKLENKLLTEVGKYPKLFA